MGKHRGRFKWKKYSERKGNLRGFWTAKDRPDSTRHRKEEDGTADSSGDTQVSP